ncbi:sorting nexin-12 [Python bivittatus]|uniref:Sorting nexin-12 n=3 Tax=Sauria TaxID=32561 RepID=A0A9F2KWH7_PYTBI|nr:sorting nexin-12 [Python bivittatus]
MNNSLYDARGIFLRFSIQGPLADSPGPWIIPPFCWVRADGNAAYRLWGPEFQNPAPWRAPRSTCFPSPGRRGVRLGAQQRRAALLGGFQTNLPIFKLKESCVRRRYSDFEWLKNELERDSKIVVPPLPGKALKRQLPFRGDEGIFEESFIEERRQGLEQFINKIAGHPLAQNERCLHMFLQEETIDRNYVPGKVRQ